MVRLIIYIHDILSLKKNQIYFIVPNGSGEDLKPCSDVKSDVDDNSKVTAATVLTSTLVLDNGHQDSDGKTYNIYTRYTFTLQNQLYFSANWITGKVGDT